MLPSGADMTKREKSDNLAEVMGWTVDGDRYLFCPAMGDLSVVRYPDGKTVRPKWFDPFDDPCDLAFPLAYVREMGWPMDHLYEEMDDHPVDIALTVLERPEVVAELIGRILGLWGD